MKTHLATLVLLGSAALALGAPASRAQISPAAKKTAELLKYVRSATSLSFMASGVAALDDCTRPLEFREMRKGALQILEILCPNGDEARFARLTYVRYVSETGQARLSPFRIEFLP